MAGRDAKKFDSARAHVLDAPERERYLPTVELIDQLRLGGDEMVVDYGAGTARVSRAIAEQLRGGELLAVDESPEMFEHLRANLADCDSARALLITGNRVPLPDGRAELHAAGLTPEPLDARLPFHFAIRASTTDIQEEN